MVKMACPFDTDILTCSEGGTVRTGTECDACGLRFELLFSTVTDLLFLTDFLTDVRAISDALVFLLPSVAADFFLVKCILMLPI